jgi:hypothetical protein
VIPIKSKTKKVNDNVKKEEQEEIDWVIDLNDKEGAEVGKKLLELENLSGESITDEWENKETVAVDVRVCLFVFLVVQPFFSNCALVGWLVGCHRCRKLLLIHLYLSILYSYIRLCHPFC